MDCGHDLEGHSGNPPENAKETAVRKRLPDACHYGIEDRSLRTSCGNRDSYTIVRTHNPKIISQIHVEERRHVESLAAILMNCIAPVFDRNHIAVPLGKGIVDLVDDGFDVTILPIAKEDAERIEAIAKRTWHAEQHDATA